MRIKILQRADELKPTMIELAQAIHSEPELSGQEHHASQRHVNLLLQNGFQVEYPFAGYPTAFTALASSSRPGPTIAYLAEYDALPEIGHGCGHSLLGAVSTIAGIVLASVVEAVGGCVMVLGCPAEETDGAKVKFADIGVFSDVDAAMLAHPYYQFCESGSSLAMEALRFEYCGEAAHAVDYPEHGINALHGLVQFFYTCMELQKQLPPTMKLNGIISQGGHAANLIPDYACADFHLRATSSSDLELLKEKVILYTENAAKGTGTTVRISSFESAYQEMISNRALSECFNQNLRSIGPVEITPPATQPFSLDMGNVSHVCPAIHPYFGVCESSCASLHTKEFAVCAASDYAYTQALVTAKALALTGLELMTDTVLLQTVQSEYNTFANSFS